MNRLIVRDEILERFQSVVAPLQICAPDGRLLGHFTPAERPYEPEYDEADLNRRIAEGGGRPLADIIRDIKKQHGLQG